MIKINVVEIDHLKSYLIQIIISAEGEGGAGGSKAVEPSRNLRLTVRRAIEEYDCASNNSL